MMDDVSRGAELLALLTPVQVKGATDDLTDDVIGRIDRAFQGALVRMSARPQMLALMVCTLLAVTGMVGGVAALALDLPEDDEGRLQGKLAALDCVRALIEREMARH